MLHFQGAGSSNEVSCFHRFNCSIRTNSHCSTGMFTGYGLAICAQPLDGQFLTSISGHQMPSPCQRIPSRPLHGHFGTAISGPPFLDANLRRPDKRSLPTFCQVFCNFLHFLFRLQDGVPSQPCGQVVCLFVAHRFPPLADLFPFPALPTAAPRPPVCGVPFSTSGAECSRAPQHRLPRGGLRRSFQNSTSRTHTR